MINSSSNARINPAFLSRSNVMGKMIVETIQMKVIVTPAVSDMNIIQCCIIGSLTQFLQTLLFNHGLKISGNFDE